jgi:hypothetical protein
LTGKYFLLINFSKSKQTQESLKSDFLKKNKRNLIFVITMPSWAFSVHGRNKDGRVMRR